jgi:hypothetical protein
MGTITIQLPDWPAGRDDATRGRQMEIVDRALQEFTEQMAIYSRSPGFLVAALGCHSAYLHGALNIGRPIEIALVAIGTQVNHELQVMLQGRAQ